MIKFKVDENLPVDAAVLLRAAGYDATTAVEQGLGGSADSRLVQACRTEGRALITLDTDFADLRAYPPRENHGLIVLRLRWQDKPHVLKVLERLLALFTVEPLEGYLWVVEEERVRIRG